MIEKGKNMHNHRIICALCGKEAFTIEESFQGYIEGSFHKIYFCKNCNTSFVLTDVDTKAIYDLIYKFAEKVPGYKRYYRYHETVINLENSLEYLASSEETYWIVKDALSRIKKNKTEINIIEIGSGLGYLTYALNKEGYNTLGIDISHNAVEKAVQQFGSNYICADVKEYASNIQKKYDVAILTEVIEHVEKPVELLQYVCSMLKSDGKIVVSTPNKTIFSKDEVWYSDLPPVHLWWFSEKSMLQIGNLLDMKVTFTDFTKYYKNKYAYAVLDPQKPKPVFSSKGVLLNRQEDFLTQQPEKATHPLKAILKKNKTLLYLVYLVRKIKYGKFLHKFGKTGMFLGIVFDKRD